MASFKESIFITSNQDLLRYAKTKKTYQSLIRDGENIISISEFGSFALKKNSTSKQAFILHVPSEGPSPVGHWCIALLEQKTRLLLFIDPLNNVLKMQPYLSQILNDFCKKNRFAWLSWNISTQKSSSNCCGLIVLYYLHFFSYHSLKGFEQLRQMLKHYPITIREATVLRKVHRIFNM